MNLENNDKIVVSLSKIKLFILLLCSLVFVAAGIWFAFYTPQTPRYNEYALLAVGAVSILFFGMCAVALLIKLFNRKPGFVVNDDGITDNSGAFANGFIPWADITSVKAVKLENAANQRMILIYVRNPEEYINKNTFFLAKKTKSANYKYYGTPITVSSNGLKIKFETLWAIVLAEHAMYLDRAANS